MSIIIQKGTIVTASDVYQADIRIDGEVISGIASKIVPAAEDKVIDANGQYVFPGGIDPHVHFGVPGYADDFVSGTRAAATGGITTIVNYVEPPADGKSLLENFRIWKEMAKDSFIDYGLQPIINAEYSESVLGELPALVEEGATSIKLFMSARGIGLLLSDVQIYKILKKARENGVLATVHCENGDVIDEIVKETLAKGNTAPIFHGYSRPTILEAEATHRVLAIAQAADAPIRIAHVSCAEAMAEIEQAQKRGVKAYGETTPHYLTKDISCLELPNFEGAKYVCSPPLREKWHQEVLWRGIVSGILTTMGSDHAPVPFEGGKTLGRDSFAKIPNGGPGVEELFSIMYHFGVHEKRISLQKFVDVTSTSTAKQLGLYPQKGNINVGSDADLVILDPKQSRTISQATHYQKCDYNAYEGTEVQGVITHVLARGEEIVQDRAFSGKPGRGQYIYRHKLNV
jgi:dihydropyrimidinase